MEWLGEPSWKLLTALFFLMAFAVLQWRAKPGRVTFFLLLTVVLIFFGVVCCGWWIVTEPEKIRISLNEMALAANQRQWPKVTAKFTQGFRTYGGMDRKAVTEKLMGLETAYGFRRVVLRQISVGSPAPDGARTARFTMRLEGASGEMEVVEIEAVLRRQGAEWLVDQVKVFRALGTGNQPLPV
ncbi:MAG: hypothetical protein ACKOS8_18160 [Gemmataceae bacterium]